MAIPSSNTTSGKSEKFIEAEQKSHAGPAYYANPLLGAALAYGVDGIPVFPCDPRNKRPLTGRGFKDASIDPSVITNWWTTWPNAMIGMPTGKSTGVWVLDVDDPAIFESECEIPLPNTKKCTTGKGYHLYFEQDDATPVRNKQKSTKGWPFSSLPGAEVRGEGGYVILPPSLHPSGRSYSWASEQKPVPPPAELIQIVCGKGGASKETSQGAQLLAEPPSAAALPALTSLDSSYGLTTLYAECEAIKSAEGGVQENTLNNSALKIGSFVQARLLSLNTAAAYLVSAGNCLKSTNQSNPWTPKHITSKIHRGLRDGMAKPSGSLSEHSSTGPQAATRLALNERPLPIERFTDITPQLTGLWLIKRLLPSQGIALLYGHPGCGKSFLALDMAVHIALGRDWHGRRVKPGAVIYVGAEGLSGLRNRVAAFRKEYCIEEASFSLIPTPIDIQAPDADVWRLINAIRLESDHFECAPALIVIDTLSKTFGAGKENTDDMASYVANCGRIASEFQCCVMPVHHRPKDAESEEPRGHGSLKGGVDTVILVEAGQTRKARVTKQKDGELGDSILFTLKPVPLGFDEDGDPVTSCIVQAALLDATAPFDPISAAIKKLPDSAMLTLRYLDKVIDDSGIPTPVSIPMSRIDRTKVHMVASLKAWREWAVSGAGTSSDKKPDSARKAFERSLARLQNDGIVMVWEGYAWRDREGFGHGRTSI